MTGKTIGETNGVWGVLFKVWLATMPICFAWMAWVTVGQVLDNSFRSIGPRFTPEQFEARAEVMLARIEPRLVRIETSIEAHARERIKPADVYQLVEKLSSRIDALSRRVKEAEQ